MASQCSLLGPRLASAIYKVGNRSTRKVAESAVMKGRWRVSCAATSRERRERGEAVLWHMPPSRKAVHEGKQAEGRKRHG